MATLPEGWEFDYDGTRWFYRYKATGTVQFHFPREGDEFTEFFDHFGPMTPEERLESKRQAGLPKKPPSDASKVTTATTATAVASSSSGSSKPTSATLSRADFFSSPFDMFGSYIDVSDDEDNTNEGPDRESLGKQKALDDDPTAHGIVEADSTPAGSQKNTPSIVNSQPLKSGAVPATTTESSTTAAVMIHELPDATVLGGRHDPVGNISELASGTVLSVGDLNPPPVELPGNDAALDSDALHVSPVEMPADSVVAVPVNQAPKPSQPTKEATETAQPTGQQRPADDISADGYRPFRAMASNSNDATRQRASSHVSGGTTVVELQDRKLGLVDDENAHKIPHAAVNPDLSEVPLALQPARPLQSQTEPARAPVPDAGLIEQDPLTPDLARPPLLPTTSLKYVPSVLKPASGRAKAESAAAPKVHGAVLSDVPLALHPAKPPTAEQTKAPNPSSTPTTTASPAPPEPTQQQLPVSMASRNDETLPSPLVPASASTPAPLSLSSVTPSSSSTEPPPEPATEAPPVRLDLMPAPLRIGHNDSQGSRGSRDYQGGLAPLDSIRPSPALSSEQAADPTLVATLPEESSEIAPPPISAPTPMQTQTPGVVSLDTMTSTDAIIAPLKPALPRPLSPSAVPAPLKTTSPPPQSPSNCGFSVLTSTEPCQLMTGPAPATAPSPSPPPTASQNSSPVPQAALPSVPTPMLASFASSDPRPAPLQTASSSTSQPQTAASHSATETYSGLMLVGELQAQPQQQQKYHQQAQGHAIKRKPTVQRKLVSSPQTPQSPKVSPNTVTTAAAVAAMYHCTSISSVASHPSDQATPGSERAPTPAQSIHSAQSVHDQENLQATATPPPQSQPQPSWQQQQQQQQSPAPSVNSLHRDSLTGSAPTPPPPTQQAVPQRMSTYGFPGTSAPAANAAMGPPPLTIHQNTPLVFPLPSATDSPQTTQQGQPGQPPQQPPYQPGPGQDAAHAHRMSLSGISGHPALPGQPGRPVVQPFFTGPPLALGGVPPPLPNRQSQQYGQPGQVGQYQPQQTQQQQQQSPPNTGFPHPQHSHTMPLPTRPPGATGTGQGQWSLQGQPLQRPHPGALSAAAGGGIMMMSPQVLPQAQQFPQQYPGARPPTMPPPRPQVVAPPAFSSDSGSRLFSKLMNSTKMQKAASSVAGAAVGQVLGISGETGAKLGAGMYSMHQAGKQQELQMQQAQQAQQHAQQQAQQAQQQVATLYQQQQRPPLQMMHTAPGQMEHGIPQAATGGWPMPHNPSPQQLQGHAFAPPSGTQQERPPVVPSSFSAPPGQLHQTQMPQPQQPVAHPGGQGTQSQPQQQPQQQQQYTPGHGPSGPSQNPPTGQTPPGQMPPPGGGSAAGMGDLGTGADFAAAIASHQGSNKPNSTQGYPSASGQHHSHNHNHNHDGHGGGHGGHAFIDQYLNQSGQQQQPPPSGPGSNGGNNSGADFVNQYLNQIGQQQQPPPSDTSNNGGTNGGTDFISQYLNQIGQPQQSPPSNPGNSGADFINQFLNQIGQQQPPPSNPGNGGGNNSGTDFISQFLNQSGQQQQPLLFGTGIQGPPGDVLVPAPSFEVVTNTQIDFVNSDNSVAVIDQTEVISTDGGVGWTSTINYSGDDWGGDVY